MQRPARRPFTTDKDIVGCKTHLTINPPYESGAGSGTRSRSAYPSSKRAVLPSPGQRSFFKSHLGLQVLLRVVGSRLQSGHSNLAQPFAHGLLAHRHRPSRGDLFAKVDRDGNLIDTMLSPTRDMRAAQRFFRSARSVAGFVPDRVTTDGHNSYPRASRSTLGRSVRH